MTDMHSTDIASRAREWAIWLTRQQSVTGSPGERALPAALAARIETDPRWKGCEAWTIPAPGDPLGRACVAVLARGSGPETILLTGHFDTVAIDDYGDLAGLATDPEALAPALIARLAAPSSEAEALALADLSSGRFLPGRGLLDMKAGLAAGLTAMEAFLRIPGRRGNLLFVGVPDEEVNSVGARALAAALPGLASERGLSVVGAINLDCIGDTGDGTAGRAVALGSVGKVLATALVVGVATHASHPLQGVNAAALAGALAARLEWAAELTDPGEGGEGIPPTLLSLKDAKRHYDVTTPDMAFATWNILTLGRSASDVFAAFERLAGEAAESCRAALAARAPRPGADVPAIPVVRAGELMAEARRDTALAGKLDALAVSLAAEGLSLPDQNERLTQAAWRMLARRGPAIVIGFGSLPYPSVLVGDGPDAKALTAAIDAAREAMRAEGEGGIGVTRFFPGISDMSFIGEGDTRGVSLIAANTPAWTQGVRWGGEVGGVPTVNIGPWGRDYHTPIERVEVAYAFGTLPRFLLEVALRRFGMARERAA